jgi:predicted RNase H-like HicB family nuclease
MGKHSKYLVEQREDGGWEVKLPRAGRASAVKQTQQEAIRRAKELAPEGVIHVKQRNGKFRKI